MAAKGSKGGAKVKRRTEATQTYWAVSQAWRRPEMASKKFTVEQALASLSTVPLYCGPKRRVSHLTLALVKEIVHRQTEPSIQSRVATIPLKAS